MKVFDLQGPMMRAARLADKICDDPEVAHRLRILERCERLREEDGLSVGGGGRGAGREPGEAIAVAASLRAGWVAGAGDSQSLVATAAVGTCSMPRPCGVCGRRFPA